MITYTLPGGGPTRTIDNKFNINDYVCWDISENVEYCGTVEKIFVTFTGIYYSVHVANRVCFEVPENELTITKNILKGEL